MNAVLETIIIDTGVGIQKDRKDLLFIPFLELKDRMGIMKTQNDNIGIGLACSRDICMKMNGDIVLKTSRKGLTAFAFKIPIKVIRPQQNEDMISVLVDNEVCSNKEIETEVVRLIGTERAIPDIVSELLDTLRIHQYNNY